MNPISSVSSRMTGGVGPTSQLSAIAKSNGEQAGSFTSQLLGNVESEGPTLDNLTTGLVNQFRQVNTMQTNADAMVHSMITGGDVNEAEVLTAVQKADLAFRMMLQIRNKLMDAYREIQQIQI
ncbi:MAG: flagellar hook-basal body complex protein FliE [Planctomycetota bacterium]